ncbi:MAG: hypothetical protein IT424_03595 [Pirellulales bacterium]|nr:hypothetical protein [Pirellulales bacterium]
MSSRPVLAASLAALAALACEFVAAPAGAAQEKAAPDLGQLVAELEKTLSHAALVGHYTVTGRDDGKLAEERYELGEVKHLGDERWLFQARIRYGDADVALPLTLPVRWAGDTPIICVDDLAVPGLGTYTARVMIYRDHYAGFWTAADHGGHLFGVIERSKDDASGDNADRSKSP